MYKSGVWLQTQLKPLVKTCKLCGASVSTVILHLKNVGSPPRPFLFGYRKFFKPVSMEVITIITTVVINVVLHVYYKGIYKGKIYYEIK